jgi:hypothetical protein
MTRLWLSTLALALMVTSIHAQDVRYSDQPPPPPPGAPGPGPGDDNAHFGWADVLRADPVQGIVRTSVPQQQCYNQQVVQHDPGNSGVGTVLGAVVGGVLGSTIGKGGGRGSDGRWCRGRRCRGQSCVGSGRAITHDPDQLPAGEYGQRSASHHWL